MAKEQPTLTGTEGDRRFDVGQSPDFQRPRPRDPGAASPACEREDSDELRHGTSDQAGSQ